MVSQFREDKWLPDEVFRKVSSPIPSIPPDAKVSSLIDANIGSWRADLISQSFLPHEAELILSIPLSIRLPQDRLIWSPSSLGCFSTHSAYKLPVSTASTSNASSSNPNPQKNFWRGLWKLCVPSKVKNFVWRASNNALPTMDNLLHHKVVLSATCNICKIHVEDTTHALCGCEGVEEAWMSLSWANLTNTSPPWISLTLFLSFCRYMMITELKFLFLFHGCCGTDGTYCA